MQLPPSSASTPGPATKRSIDGKKSSIFPSGYLFPFLLTTLIFFVWGMSNNLTDILVQQFKKSFSLSLLQAQLVQTSVFLAYGTMAIPAALLTRRFGYKAGLLTGLVVFGIGTLLFWPAAVLGVYAPFLVALFVVGSGSSILETSANPLIAQFGDPGTSELRLNFAQAFNPPGTITGVLIGTWFIFSGVEKNPSEIAAMQTQGTYAGYLHSEIVRVVPTYVGIGIAVLVLAAFIALARFPANIDDEVATGDGKVVPEHGGFGRLLRNPRLMFAVVTQFFYVGAQVSTWSVFIPYMRTYSAVSERTAGYLLTATLAAFAIGRIVTTPLMRYISPGKLIGVYGLVNVVLISVGVFRPGMTGIYAILVTSFFMSVMYPTIFALGVKDLGRDTKLGSSFIVMSIVGGAIFPPLMGWVARLTGSVALGYLLPGIGYVVVACYAFLVPRTVPRTDSLHEA